jgi:hypothetical protein
MRTLLFSYSLNQEISELDGNQNTEIISNEINPKAEIKILISEGKIEEAIQQLMNNSGDNQLTMPSARYNRIKN